MQLVVDIDDSKYNDIMWRKQKGIILGKLERAISNGKPLPSEEPKKEGKE